MLVGSFCAALCAAALAIVPRSDGYGQADVMLFGHPVGRYVDNEQPQECQAVAEELMLGTPLVIAGIAPSGGPSCPGAVNVREWFPFDCRYPPGTWGPVPKAAGYILQGTFAWAGCKPPTMAERRGLLKRAEGWHPRLVLWY